MKTATHTQSNKQTAYLRPAEAATYASVTRSTIYAWIKTKLLKSYSIKGVRLLKISDIDAMIEGRAEA
jgi:excisionase family DNA binding protein